MGIIVAMVVALTGFVLAMGAMMGTMYLMGDTAVGALLGVFFMGLVMIAAAVISVQVCIAIDDR